VVRDGPAASAAQMDTRLATFSAQFLTSCAAKPQVSGLHPVRIADREPSQATLESRLATSGATVRPRARLTTSSQLSTLSIADATGLGSLPSAEGARYFEFLDNPHFAHPLPRRQCKQSARQRTPNEHQSGSRRAGGDR